MTLSKFEEILRRFGPVVDLWPAELIDPALDLLQASTAAQDLFTRASAPPPGSAQTGAAASCGEETNFTRSKAVH
jgi:hypothetical protein